MPTTEVTFEPTQDSAYVTEFLCHPEIFPWSSDDGTPPQREFRFEINEHCLALIIRIGGRVGGVAYLVPSNTICWTLHVSFYPWARGKRAAGAGQSLFEWLWTNTKCERICVEIPEFNRPAMILAAICGMRRYGVNPMSFRKNGVLYNQVLFGINRMKVGA